jgi:hypothetical protein
LNRIEVPGEALVKVVKNTYAKNSDEHMASDLARFRSPQ